MKTIQKTASGFSGMSDDELSEIVNSGGGRYRQEVVDGAENELERRGGDNVRHHTAGGVRPPPSPETVSVGRLFSAGQVSLATFFGAPMAGCLLLAQNYRALGKGGSAWRPLAVGTISTILLMILALFLPEKFPALWLPAGSCFGMYHYAKQRQGGAIDYHLKAGGRKGSTWVTIGVGLCCSVVIVVLLVAIVITFDIEPPGGEPGGPVAQVRVSQAGRIELNGTEVTLEQLRAALMRLRDEDGRVWYYRERLAEPPPAVALEVIRIVVDAGLPVRLSSKPDFSDYIDGEGNSVPSP